MEIAKFQQSGLPANPDELLGGLENVNQSLKAASGGLPFLRLLTDGVFVYGADNTEVQDGSNWAANPYTLQHGFACWDSDNSALLDEVMVAMNQPKPAVTDLPDLGFAWRPQVALQLQCLNGDDEGVTVLYKGTSLGLQNAVKELTAKIIGQIKSEEPFVPVLELMSDHYTHKKHGRTYTPALEIVEWISMDGQPAEEAEAPDDEPLEPVAGATKKKAAAKKAPKKKATTRRRRAAVAPE